MKRNAVLVILLLTILFTNGCGTELIQRAESNYLARDYQPAAQLFDLYLTDHPDAFVARRRLGHALLKTGHPREAAFQFEKVIASHPGDSLSYLYLGLTYLHLADYPKTMAAWQQYEAIGKPLIISEVNRQTPLITEAIQKNLPDDGLNDLAKKIESAIEQAISADQLRNDYNRSRLGECG
ncbi:MAG: tetratricopeptide repeat protein [Proteobacteria bacterium]|nr:tetratricopeptide repeat protein [Pseudomonadota bacterium]MBU1714067.1 tetratricopeptide repeat protein [Pseudomonadota bacterium]